MTEQEIEIEDLRAALTEMQGKLFDAGKLAGRQETLISLLMAALEGIVEPGTDSPEHQQAVDAIIMAKAFKAE